MKRIALFGPPATGKTTMARVLADRFGLPHTALDELIFTPKGVVGEEDFRSAADVITDGPAWVVEGNFSKLSDVVWDKAEVLLWLDFRLPLILRRLAVRSVRQLTGREPNAHHLTWRKAIRMLRRAVYKYRKNRPRYREQVAATAARGVEVVYLRTPEQAERWLRENNL